MTPAIAFTVGGTIAASVTIVAQDVVTSNSSAGANLTIFGVGVAIIGWLVKRERDDRIADRLQMVEDNKARRADDAMLRDDLHQAQDETHAEREANRVLYERMLDLALLVPVSTEGE